MNKDLIADILPPPFYLIESYLTVTQIITFYNTINLSQELATLEKLEKDYYERYKFWIDNLPDGDLKQTITLLAYNPCG